MVKINWNHLFIISFKIIIKGLVCRVVPAEKLLDEALSMAEKIASFSIPSIYIFTQPIMKKCLIILFSFNDV